MQVVAKPWSDAAGDEADDYEWCEDRHQADCTRKLLLRVSENKASPPIV